VGNAEGFSLKIVKKLLMHFILVLKYLSMIESKINRGGKRSKKKEYSHEFRWVVIQA